MGSCVLSHSIQQRGDRGMIQLQYIAKTMLSGFEIKLASTSREEDRGGRGRYQKAG